MQRWCGRLQLVAKVNGLEFHDFYNCQHTHGEKNVKLYYYLKVWIIVVHDHFQNIFNILEIK
jgi:hypothetical protein